MKHRRVSMYYCDFCTKKSGSAAVLKKHEIHCTLNPNRRCGFCEIMGEAPIRPPALAVTFKMMGLEGVKKEAHGCPACVLAFVRSELPKVDKRTFVDMMISSMNGMETFDYHAEVKRFWEEHPRSERE